MSVRYLAFLRAVNVGGRSMPMAELRAELSALGFTGVGTVIQTGNAFFDAGRTSRAKITGTIEAALQERFGFAVPVMLRTTSEVRATLEASPLRYKAGEPVVDKERLVMFLDRAIKESTSWPVSNARGDVVITGVVSSAASASDAFVDLRRIEGRTPNSAAFVEKQLGAVGTGRWLHTTERILRTAEDS